MEGDNSFTVLFCSTPSTLLETKFTHTQSELLLSQDDLIVDLLPALCDKENLFDQTSLISTLEIIHGHVQPDLDDKHVVFPNVQCIDDEKEELKLISSLNTLGYIEFDVLPNLKCLEENFFSQFQFPMF